MDHKLNERRARSYRKDTTTNAPSAGSPRCPHLANQWRGFIHSSNVILNTHHQHHHDATIITFIAASAAGAPRGYSAATSQAKWMYASRRSRSGPDVVIIVGQRYLNQRSHYYLLNFVTDQDLGRQANRLSVRRPLTANTRWAAPSVVGGHENKLVNHICGPAPCVASVCILFQVQFTISRRELI